MKKTWILLSVANFCLVILLGVVLAFHFFRAPTYAFVVNQKVFAEFKGREELNSKFEYLQQRHKEVLDSMYMELQRGNNEVSMEIFQERSRKFLEDEQQVSERYTQQIWKQINEYLHDYGKEYGYDMILGADGTGSLMYANEAIDITDHLIEYVNRKYQGE